MITYIVQIDGLNLRSVCCGIASICILCVHSFIALDDSSLPWAWACCGCFTWTNLTMLTCINFIHTACLSHTYVTVIRWKCRKTGIFVCAVLIDVFRNRNLRSKQQQQQQNKEKEGKSWEGTEGERAERSTLKWRALWEFSSFFALITLHSLDVVWNSVSSVCRRKNLFSKRRHHFWN